MIYCVVPADLGPELYEKLADYYEDDPNVKVIVDRRSRERRDRAATSGGENREKRDRRRSRVPGEFPSVDPS
jgi:hypothetical protein